MCFSSRTNAGGSAVDIYITHRPEKALLQQFPGRAAGYLLPNEEATERKKANGTAVWLCYAVVPPPRSWARFTNVELKRLDRTVTAAHAMSFGGSSRTGRQTFTMDDWNLIHAPRKVEGCNRHPLASGNSTKHNKITDDATHQVEGATNQISRRPRTDGKLDQIWRKIWAILSQIQTRTIIIGQFVLFSTKTFMNVFQICLLEISEKCKNFTEPHEAIIDCSNKT